MALRDDVVAESEDLHAPRLTSTDLRDRRGSARVSVELEIHYQDHQSKPVNGPLANISEGGAFVRTPHPLELGTVFDFCLSLPDGVGKLIRGKGMVAWTEPRHGMGIQFLGLHEEQRKRIRFWVASQLFGP